MFGLSDKGFKRKRYADIRADLVVRWKESFGENSRTEERTPNGIFISLIAYIASPLWMLAEKVYNNAFVHKASGNPLSELVRNKLIERRPAEKAAGIIEISGDNETVIEAGFRVANKVEYVTTETVEIDETGKVFAPIIADVAGSEGNSRPDEVTDIITPIVGVDEVTNPDVISGGRDAETDTELRARYELSLSAAGSPTTNGIRAEVLGVQGVLTANVIENLSLDTVDGRPGRSFETYALGGDDEAIAKAIFTRRAAGIEAYGNTVIDVTDDAGNITPIGFTRANEVTVYVEVEVKTNNEYPSNGDEQIKTALIEFIGGTDYNGNIYAGLQTGQNVYFTRLIGIIDSIAGVERVITLNVGTSAGDLQPMQDIDVEGTEVATTDYEKVVIL